jgi:hypothetical protein
LARQEGNDVASTDFRPDDAQRLDGNAAAGLLADCFRFDLTTAVIICAGCGTEGPLGAYPVYGMPLGAVIRCASCDGVVARVAETHGRIWLDLRGTKSMRIEPRG